MDRLESVLESGTLAHLSRAEKASIRVAGLLIPGLLFADDIVFFGTQARVVQKVMDGLSGFAATNSLTVSLAKTEWLVSTKRAGANWRV